MKEHRSTQGRIPNEPQNSNFAAGTALENLRAEVIEIEALPRRRGGCRRRAPRADDRSPAPGVRADPVAHHEGITTGERIAPVRERAGHRAHGADGGTAQSRTLNGLEPECGPLHRVGGPDAGAFIAQVPAQQRGRGMLHCSSPYWPFSSSPDQRSKIRKRSIGMGTGL